VCLRCNQKHSYEKRRIQNSIDEASENNPSNTLFHEGNVKIQEQAKSYFGKFQISQNLGIVNREQSFDRLQFDNDAAANEQVETESGIYGNSVVHNRNSYLLFVPYCSFLEFYTKTSFIHGLEESWLERGMNFYGRIYHLCGDSLGLFWQCGSSTHVIRGPG